MRERIVLSKTVKKNSFLNRNIYCITSAVVAAVIILFAYIVWKFFPVGDNIILRMDLYHQYAPLFAELYERIFGGHSLIYSFTSGLGSGFLGNYFNYLSSPTMLFVLIFGHKNIPEAIAAMVLVKAAASAYTFTYFLGKITKKSSVSTAVFGLLYAFSGYFIAYYWNIMWLDAVVAFPLVILGIWYIIEKNNGLMYVLSLAFVMLTNYYMAYMVCILSVIFFLYLYFSERQFGTVLNKNVILKNKYKKSLTVGFYNSSFLMRGVKFAAASILAALIAAFALLPVFFILRNSSATNSTAPTSFASYFTVFDFLANHLAGVEPTIRSSGNTVYPNVYCGILTLMLVPLYMFSKKFSVREKIATTSVIALFFFSFNINVLNYVWHGFHFPNDLPYRFSFAYSFFLLFIAYKVFINLDSISSKSILASACGVAAFTAIVEKVGSANVDIRVVWSSIIFAIVYAVVLVFMKNPKYVKSSIAILLLTAVCAEILVADTPNYKVTQTKESYTSSYDDTKAAVDFVKEQEGENSLYRMELATLLTRMDNCWFFYPGVSTFTSMAYEDVAHLQDYLGMYGNKINSYTYNCQTGLYNSMMSLKYIVDNHDYVPTDNYKPKMDGNFLYEKVYTDNEMTVYKNNYWLPVAFSANSSIDASWNYNSGNPFDVQNDFFYNASGVADILSPLEGKVSDLNNIEAIADNKLNSGSFNMYKENTSSETNEATFTYKVPSTQNVYVYINSSDIESALIVADGFTYNQNISGKGYVIDLGTLNADTEVTITYSLKKDSASGAVEQYVYGMNQEKFVSAYNAIIDNGVLEVSENKEHYIKGTVKLAANKMLFTSIPYDKSWSVFVDGEKLDEENIVKVGDALMGINMAEGEHTVELKYNPKGLAVGAIASVVGILILVLLIILKKKKKFVYSASYKADYLELGRWRDKGAEAEREESKIAEQEKFDEMLRESDSDSMINSEADDAWSVALEEAERFAKTKYLSSNDSTETEESAEYVEEATEAAEIPEEQEQAEYAEEAPAADGTVDDSEFEDDFYSEDMFDEESIDSVLEQFEKSEEAKETPKKNKISAEDKKSAQKKRLNLTIFVIVIIAVIVTGLGIIIHAAKNAGKTPDTSGSDSIITIENKTEDESLTAAKTTAQTTTEAETTTEVRTTAVNTTAARTTERVTAPPATTAARTTAAPQTEGYTGAYQSYTVKSGDNFYAILRSFGIADTPANVQTMCDFNGISVNSGLSVGQVIKVPTDLK